MTKCERCDEKTKFLDVYFIDSIINSSICESCLDELVPLMVNWYNKKAKKKIPFDSEKIESKSAITHNKPLESKN